MKNMLRNKKGQGLAEYAVILVGVTVVSLGALSTLGHNIGDLLASTAAILPGSAILYDQQVFVGELIEVNTPALPNTDGITLAVDDINANISSGTTNRMAHNVTNDLFGTDWENLVFERT